MKVERGKLTWRKKLHNVEHRLTQRGASKRTACRGGIFPTEREEMVSWIFGLAPLLLREANGFQADLNTAFAA